MSSDERIRELGRRVEQGDATALEHLVRDLERRGTFEDILARLQALLDEVQTQRPPRRPVRGDLSVFHFVEGVKGVLEGSTSSAFVCRREWLSPANRSPHFPFDLSYLALDAARDEIHVGAGACDPDDLSTLERTSADGRRGSIPERTLTIPRSVAMAWVRWCESDPRTQRRGRELEHVRLRPAMYIGSTGCEGLQQIADECILDAIAEVLRGTATTIRVTIGRDGSLEVDDDGPGVPIAPADERGRSPIERCFGTLDGRRRPRDVRVGWEQYPGAFGVGPAVVNFLSSRFDVEFTRDGERWHQRFERGQPATPFARRGPTELRGTRVRFLPDPTIFTESGFDYGALAQRLEDLAYLHPERDFGLVDQTTGKSVVHRSENGLADLVARIAAEGLRIVERIFSVNVEEQISLHAGTTHIDIALAWTRREETRIRSFVNGLPTLDGGTHVRGLELGLASALEDAGLGVHPTLDNARPGLVAAISVQHPDPHYEGATRSRLGNPEVVDLVRRVVAPSLAAYFREHPRLIDALRAGGGYR
ncbi:MAG: hypothetical protein ACAI25_10235 [Planctomycetota bacterium]